MNIPKISEIIEALKSLFSKPYTTGFPKKPHLPAPEFRGKPEYHEEDCVGCGACFEVCPGKAITLEDYKDENGVWKRKLTINYDSCIFCGQCERNCITEKGIQLSREYDVSTTEKRQELTNTVEKELEVCEICGKPIAAKEHIVWVAKKIGHHIISNTSLFYAYLKNRGLALPTPPKSSDESLRQDRFKLLCPECRRKAVLKS